MNTSTDSQGRRLLTRACIILVVAAMIVGIAGCHHFIPSRNLDIRTWYDLDQVRRNLSGHHRLMNNLDASTPGYDELAGPTANEGRGWKPIGEPFPPGPYFPFRGTFDGQGYEISDLFINRYNEAEVGLFTALSSPEAVIENLGVVNARVTGYWHVGGLVGTNDRGTLRNCYVSGTVIARRVGLITDAHYVGGLVGNNYGALVNSHFTGDVSGAYYVGGLVGLNDGGTIRDSYSTGSVQGLSTVGGLVGEIRSGTIGNSHYSLDEALINELSLITIGALSGEDFDNWLANGRSLSVSEKLSQEDGYYVLNNITDFKRLLAFGQDDSLRFRLKEDLDLRDDPGFFIPYLAGEFHGNEHSISNLTIDLPFVSQVGLFGRLTPDGKVSHTRVENADITGHERVGGIVGYNEGTVSNCCWVGTVHGDEYVGGLVGYNGGTVGYSSSSVTVIGRRSVGGLVGYNEDSSSGGLVEGNSFGAINASYSSGNVTCHSREAGGLVGRNTGAIRDCYATSSVAGDEYVGGLVGFNSHAIHDCYSTGRVIGKSYVGGLVGFSSQLNTVHNSFWDTETSMQDDSDGGTARTTLEMQNFATYADTATEGLQDPWEISSVAPGQTDETHIWNIVDGATYPFLSWQE